jgi:hypothetical protein
VLGTAREAKERAVPGSRDHPFRARQTVFHRWCVGPTQRIIAKVRSHIPDAKVTGFPRGVGTALLRYVDDVPIDAVSE